MTDHLKIALYKLTFEIKKRNKSMINRFNKMREKFNQRTLCLGIMAAFVMAVPLHVFAQGFVLEEVVVTARKRTENLQEVPDSITAFGRSQIESAGIDLIDQH